MTKIMYDQLVINQRIKPNLDTIIDSLNNTIISMNELKIPNDFVYKNALRKHRDSTSKIKDDVIKYKDWIEDFDNKIKDVEEDYANEINSINNLEIKVRQRKIVK